MPHTNHLNRRSWLKTNALLASGVWLGTGLRQATAGSALEKLNIACIGIGGRGAANVDGVAKLNQNLIALCDVDEQRAGNMYERFPQAKKYGDFRKMYDDLEQQIDAVVISTPDHAHFHPSYRALEMGKHLYLEKPMAHDINEVRRLTNLAEEKKVATQLGVQRHTIENMHRVVELIKAGAIGRVSEVHCWIDSDRGMPKIPTDKPPVPKTLDWDLWLGPAKERSYHSTYAPYGWRFWWDFGTGETGNWGCHILDIPFWALDLKYPQRVSGSGPQVDAETTPKTMASQLVFAATASRPEVTLHWSQVKGGPEILRKHQLPAKNNNTLFIGSDGMLLCGFSQRKLYPEEKFASYESPEKSIPNSPGFYREWIDACNGGEPATCHFGYSGPLSESVLLGNVAYRSQTEFNWDAEKLIASNDQAQKMVSSKYRKGWEI
jgi:predicted dehydrogenase